MAAQPQAPVAPVPPVNPLATMWGCSGAAVPGYAVRANVSVRIPVNQAELGLHAHRDRAAVPLASVFTEDRVARVDFALLPHAGVGDKASFALQANVTVEQQSLRKFFVHAFSAEILEPGANVHHGACSRSRLITFEPFTAKVTHRTLLEHSVLMKNYNRYATIGGIMNLRLYFAFEVTGISRAEPKPAPQLTEDFAAANTFFDSGTDADVTFSFDDGRTIPAHSVILMFKSEYFRRAFTTSLVSDDPKNIKMRDESYDVVHLFLRLLYCGPGTN